ncbi:hypothetical protein C8J57DRAFT_1639082 [Mycena rebaudengoi]|nr:hypothetical protein C8J57DRAFT_1639082 [Mycena rebaudengoi]
MWGAGACTASSCARAGPEPGRRAAGAGVAGVAAYAAGAAGAPGHVAVADVAVPGASRAAPGASTAAAAPHPDTPPPVPPPDTSAATTLLPHKRRPHALHAPSPCVPPSSYASVLSLQLVRLLLRPVPVHGGVGERRGKDDAQPAHPSRLLRGPGARVTAAVLRVAAVVGVLGRSVHDAGLGGPRHIHHLRITLVRFTPVVRRGRRGRGEYARGAMRSRQRGCVASRSRRRVVLRSRRHAPCRRGRCIPPCCPPPHPLPPPKSTLPRRSTTRTWRSSRMWTRTTQRCEGVEVEVLQ